MNPSGIIDNFYESVYGSSILEPLIKHPFLGFMVVLLAFVLPVLIVKIRHGDILSIKKSLIATTLACIPPWGLVYGAPSLLFLWVAAIFAKKTISVTSEDKEG